MGVRFPQSLGLFQGLKIGVLSICLGETSILKNDWQRYFVVIAFINSISQTDDNQDVSDRTVGGKVDVLAPGRGGVVRPLRPPCGYGPDKHWQMS